jgi:hypothetical protein
MLVKQLDELVDFGPTTPVTISREATRYLEELPRAALSAVMNALRTWAKGVPLKAVQVTVFSDPEAADSSEIVINLLLDCDTDSALLHWESMEAFLAKVRGSLHTEDRARLDALLGIHLLWGADDWTEDAAGF